MLPKRQPFSQDPPKEFPICPETFNEENLQGLGLLSRTIYFRLLLLAACRPTVAFRKQWLADAVLMPKDRPKQNHLSRALKQLESYGYLIPLGEKHDDRDVYEIRRRWKGDECGLSFHPERKLPSNLDGYASVHPGWKLPSNLDGFSVQVGRDTIEEKEESSEEIPLTPKGIVADPVAALSPDDRPYSHSCPAPTWVVKRWITWANPGVVAESFESGKLFKYILKLASSWNSYPDPDLWRWMFDYWKPGVTKDVRTGIADLTHLLGRANAEIKSAAPKVKRLRPDQCETRSCQGTSRHTFEGKRLCSPCLCRIADARFTTPEALLPSFEEDRYGPSVVETQNAPRTPLIGLRTKPRPANKEARKAGPHLRNGTH